MAASRSSKSPVKRPAVRRRPVPAPVPATGDEAVSSTAPRAPQQSRGQKRVEEILDAAEAVFAEVGLEAATTHAIAERAGASVGSIYHFFPSKDAIVRAVCERFSDMMRATNAQAMPPEAAHIPIEKLFERIVMDQVRLVERHPAINAVFTDDCRIIIGDEAWNRIEDEIVGQVKRFLSARMPRMPKKEMDIASRISVLVVDRVLDAARRGRPEERHGLLRELQTMMVRYFRPLDEKYGAAHAR
jgi:AcrR family transcriptional regulator